MDMHASFHPFLQCKQGMKEEQMLSSSSLGKIYRNAFLQVNRCLSSSSSMILASPFRYASSLLGIHVGNTAGSGMGVSVLAGYFCNFILDSFRALPPTSKPGKQLDAGCLHAPSPLAGPLRLKPH
jgi:hypothetical protein